MFYQQGVLQTPITRHVFSTATSSYSTTMTPGCFLKSKQSLFLESGFAWGTGVGGWKLGGKKSKEAGKIRLLVNPELFP